VSCSESVENTDLQRAFKKCPLIFFFTGVHLCGLPRFKDFLIFKSGNYGQKKEKKQQEKKQW
jgi:hypothetical protein